MRRLIGGNLEIDGQLYMFHHTALTAGYVNRKTSMQECIDAAEEYHGRYGDGYTVRTPNYNTSRYCDLTYYIARKEENQEREENEYEKRNYECTCCRGCNRGKS